MNRSVTSSSIVDSATTRPARFGWRALAPHWLAEFARAPGRSTEFAAYIGASGISFSFDTGIFLALVWLDVAPAALAGAIGYACGMLLNYMICIRYIFDTQATGKSSRRLIVEYVASGLFGVALTYGLIGLLHGSLGLSPLLAKLITVAIVFLTVYLVRSAKVFAAKPAAN